MGILTLLFALGETISETISEKRAARIALEEKQRYENIDFYNIESVTFDGTETAYRIETEEEFDPVMTDFLTRQDGWQHYETETVEYEVPNGLNYCFTIKYKNGETIYRAFHESSHLTKRLLEYCDDEEYSDDFFDEISNYDCNTTSPSKLKAIKEARDYLVYNSGFSYLGLIKQLEYNKISHEDAVYAADNCGANWNNQALKSAKSYLSNCSGFSHSRLIYQLEKIDEFTPEQAKYGADNCGANWNSQALKEAKSYLKYSKCSKQDLIEHLKYEGFTDEQIEYGIAFVN